MNRHSKVLGRLAADDTPSVLQPAGVAAPGFIAPLKLRRLMAQDPALDLLDVRTPDEFAEVRVPRARNFPLGSLLAGKLLADKAVDRRRPIYLICQADDRSKIAAEKFLTAGHPSPFVVAGGTLAWIAASLPVNRGSGKHP